MHNRRFHPAVIVISVVASLAVMAEEPRQNVTANSNYPGTYGSVILEGDDAFPNAGVVLRAGSRPSVAVSLGSPQGSAFVVFNSSNAELLRVQNNGFVGIGNSTPTESLTIGNGTANNDLSIGTVTQNALHIGTFYDHFAIAANRRVRDGQWVKSTFPTATIVFETYSANSSIVFRTSNANGVMDKERMRVDKDGNVFIGHAYDSPDAALHIRGGSRPLQITSRNSGGYGVVFRDLLATEPYGYGMVMEMGGNSMLSVSNLEIGGTGAPELRPKGAPLHVKGNVDVTGDLHVTGKISGATVLNAVWQDIAEWVVTDEPLAAGTVVIVDPASDDQVVASTQAYDTRVAGVISPQPGIVLGGAAANKVQVATTGRVRVRVDATGGAIARGDLLVSSDRPGVAMKSIPVELGGVALHRPGTLIGKALEPLAGGEGEILVLLSLQ